MKLTVSTDLSLSNTENHLNIHFSFVQLKKISVLPKVSASKKKISHPPPPLWLLKLGVL